MLVPRPVQREGGDDGGPHRTDRWRSCPHLHAEGHQEDDQAEGQGGDRRQPAGVRIQLCCISTGNTQPVLRPEPESIVPKHKTDWHLLHTEFIYG